MQTKMSTRNAVLSTNLLWPSGVVPYIISGVYGKKCAKKPKVLSLFSLHFKDTFNINLSKNSIKTL